MLNMPPMVGVGTAEAVGVVAVAAKFCKAVTRSWALAIAGVGDGGDALGDEELCSLSELEDQPSGVSTKVKLLGVLWFELEFDPAGVLGFESLSFVT